MELIDLRRGDCLRLLAGETVGRVVYIEDALPAARPVTYLLDGTEVVFGATSGSTLATATERQVVGFEVDAFDPATRTGWSVLGVGVAYRVVDRDRLGGLARCVPEPWAGGPATSTIAIPLQLLTGRRLGRARPRR
jgi:hypothetical protein